MSKNLMTPEEATARYAQLRASKAKRYTDKVAHLASQGNMQQAQAMADRFGVPMPNENQSSTPAPAQPSTAKPKSESSFLDTFNLLAETDSLAASRFYSAYSKEILAEKADHQILSALSSKRDEVKHSTPAAGTCAATFTALCKTDPRAASKFYGQNAERILRGE